MKPARSAVYLAWIRTQPCVVCGRTRWIEAAHTGLRGLGQKSSDYSAIPLCAMHHRTGKDSYHRLGARQFAQTHNLDIHGMVRRLNMKPTVRIEGGMFVAHLEGQAYRVGRVSNGIAAAISNVRKACGENRLAPEVVSELQECWSGTPLLPPREEQQKSINTTAISREL